MKPTLRANVASSFTVIKGAMIEETYAAFAVWDFCRSKRENLDLLRSENFIGARSATWLRDVAWVLNRRFEPHGRDRALVDLAKKGCELEEWKPVLLWHMTRDEFLEYVVTDAIRSHYTGVLEAYQETPNKPHEGIAIWVSGFFGSGKSSFAKMLERRAMREASQAPRNSRELAARNQFFTPRYVVQFLTDNTLGRIWYEMRGTTTALAQRCEYMVRRPGETFAPRPKKDPRELRVLDPACGSGHFLLYAFDLLLTIYEEAHADPEGLKNDATRRTLAEDYPSLDALKKATPGLILAHNLYGVDIDPRCAQIAQLALWMRAQRAFRDADIRRAERPLIRRSNIIVAEPIGADAEMVEQFSASIDDRMLRELFEQMIASFKLAGDLGLLLRVEQALKVPNKVQMGLFRSAEEQLHETLVRFVNEALDSQRTRRRLFADDAEQSMGLIEISSKRFDVVLMNPPFGAGSTRAKKEFEKIYPRTKSDVYAAFVERGIELLQPRARLGAITSRTGFFLSSFQKWREEILLQKAPPVVFADLGYGVLDSAMVETAAYCLEAPA